MAAAQVIQQLLLRLCIKHWALGMEHFALFCKSSCPYRPVFHIWSLALVLVPDFAATEFQVTLTFQEDFRRKGWSCSKLFIFPFRGLDSHHYTYTRLGPERRHIVNTLSRVQRREICGLFLLRPEWMTRIFVIPNFLTVQILFYGKMKKIFG